MEAAKRPLARPYRHAGKARLHGPGPAAGQELYPQILSFLDEQQRGLTVEPAHGALEVLIPTGIVP